jgi:ABC-2 type transport system permease protein
MISYMKSEIYRLLRKRGLYITGLVCYLLIAAAAIVLYLSHQQDPSFPYATSNFFYSNVIASGILIIGVGFIFNLGLTGRDREVAKQSISFGISRQTIFWSKLMLTLSYFLIICAVGMLITLSLGEALLIKDSEIESVRNFWVAGINMLPLVLSGFFVLHSMKMLGIDDIYIIFTLVFLYVFSGDLLRTLLRPIAGLNEVYQYAPDTLLNDNLMMYVDGAAQFDGTPWITGLIISVVVLLVGSKRFAKKDIDG